MLEYGCHAGAPRMNAPARRAPALLLCMLAVVTARAEATDDDNATLVDPGVISTGDSESHATFAPDGNTLYFVKLTPDFAHWTIVVSERTGGHRGPPAIAWFSGRWDDADMSFAPDGNTIYFVSDRPDGDARAARPDTDLFRMRRTATGWSEPERIVELSSPLSEWYPNQARDGTLYFGSERRDGNLGPEGTADLWLARPQGDHFGAPQNLGPVINTAGQDIEPWISADQQTLIYASKGRADTLGSYDLYVSRRCGTGWSEPHPLGGGVNSAGWEFGGRLSPDQRTFYFGSNRALDPPAHALSGREGYAQLSAALRAPGNGLFDIYAVAADRLGTPASCPGTP